MSKNENFTKYGENIALDNKTVAVSNQVDIQVKKEANVKNSFISAGKGINIQGGSIKILGGSIISGGNIKISSGGNVVLDGATIKGNEVSLTAQNTKVNHQVSLEAAKTSLKSKTLDIADDSSLDVKADKYEESIEEKKLGNNASYNVIENKK